MSNGVAQRAQIDTETVRALLLINGGGAVALLTLLPSILESKVYRQFATPMLIGVIIFMIGLFCATVHNRLRRKCSLVYDQHNGHPPPGTFLWKQLEEPTVCFVSISYMWCSIAAFALAGLVVAVNGLRVMANTAQ